MDMTRMPAPTVEEYSDLIRELCCRLSVGGWNSEGLIPIETARAKICDGLEMLTAPLHRQIAELRATVENND
jgi:hypothetical protein